MSVTLPFTWRGDSGTSRPLLLQALRARFPLAWPLVFQFVQGERQGSGYLELHFFGAIGRDLAAEIAAFVAEAIPGAELTWPRDGGLNAADALAAAEAILRQLPEVGPQDRGFASPPGGAT